VAPTVTLPDARPGGGESLNHLMIMENHRDWHWHPGGSPAAGRHSGSVWQALPRRLQSEPTSSRRPPAAVSDWDGSNLSQAASSFQGPNSAATQFGDLLDSVSSTPVRPAAGSNSALDSCQ
jgi:hypothetical protein